MSSSSNSTPITIVRSFSTCASRGVLRQSLSLSGAEKSLRVFEREFSRQCFLSGVPYDSESWVLSILSNGGVFLRDTGCETIAYGNDLTGWVGELSPLAYSVGVNLIAGSKLVCTLEAFGLNTFEAKRNHQLLRDYVNQLDEAQSVLAFISDEEVA